MRKVFSIKLSEIKEAPFSMSFGPKYHNYSTVGIKHLSGKVIQFLFDKNGNCVEQENKITEQIEQDFIAQGVKPKFARCVIEGVYCLALQLPKI